MSGCILPPILVNYIFCLRYSTLFIIYSIAFALEFDVILMSLYLYNQSYTLSSFPIPVFDTTVRIIN